MAKSGSGRVTLQDVADRTGYTVNTISRALRDKEDISPETREHVRRVAAEMGYVRNHMASSLRSGRTKTLGLILGSLQNPYYAIMANEMQKAAEEKGYILIILSSQDESEREQKMVDVALGHQVDGILLFPTAQSEPVLDRLRTARIPHVLLARLPGDNHSDSVLADDAQGARLITRHLIEAGRRKLGYLSYEDVLYSQSQRLAGFHRACDEAGIPLEDRRVSVASGRPAGELLAGWFKEGISGAFVFCDMEAWRTVSELNALGIRIPEDLAIVGFDNIQARLQFPWPLCSVEVDYHTFARQAISLIRRQIHREEGYRQFICPTSVVCRGSCGCLRKS